MFGLFPNFFDEGFWLPNKVTWSSMKSTPYDRYAQPSDLYVCFLIVPLIFVFRRLFVNYIATNIGLALGLKRRASVVQSDPTNETKAILTNAFHLSDQPTNFQVDLIVKKTDLSETYVLNWFRQQRNFQKPSRLDKFNECCVYFTWYTSIFCFGVFAVHDKCWLFETKHFWKNYPLHPLHQTICAYYVASISFYLSEVIATMFKTIKRNDDLQMSIHHAVTLSLLFSSYWMNHTRIGSITLVLHDFADIWLQLGKMARYVDAPNICDAAFAMLATSWFVTRLVLYPLYPVYSALYEAEEFCDYFSLRRWTSWHACVGLLLALLLMNVLWFLRIVVAIVEKIKSGEVKDNRSDDDE